MEQKSDRRLARWSVCVWLLLSLTGCGDSSDRKSLEGTVTLDGVPLAEGDIAFVPLNGTQGPTAGGKITKGEFFVSPEGGTFVGKFRVKISAIRKTGKQVPDPTASMMDPSVKVGLVDDYEQYIPARYNEQSELTAEVTAGGENRFPFALSSQR